MSKFYFVELKGCVVAHMTAYSALIDPAPQ
jgi:hypothetical protein